MGGITEKFSAMPEKMAETQKSTMLAQREVMMITQVAKMRDDFVWLSAFWATFGSILVAGSVKTGKPLWIPLIPGGFSLAYMYDGAFGNKFTRVRENAEEIYKDTAEREKYNLPRGNAMMSPEDYTYKIIHAKKK